MFSPSSLCFVGLMFFVLIGSPSFGFAKKTTGKAKAKASASMEPDFAFPQTVEKNAGIQLENALKKYDYPGVIKASISMNVASGLISSETYAASLSRYDSLAKVLPSPWSNLALLLEARLYSDIYLSKPWIFNNRQLPLTPRSENVLEWSKPMFAQVIGDLCGKSLQHADELSSLPISTISALLDKSSEAQKRGFSVFDFISQQAIGMLANFDSDSEAELLPLRAIGGESLMPSANNSVHYNFTVNSIVDSAISRSESEGNLFKIAYWSNIKLGRLQEAQRKEYLKECIERFKDTPYCADFICSYCNMLPDDNPGRREQMKLLEDYIKRFPDADRINSVKNQLAELRQVNINVAFSSQLLPGQPNNVVVSGENLYDFHILAISLPEKSNKDSYRYSNLAGGRVVASVPVKEIATVPDRFNDTITLPALPPGTYAIVPSRTTTSGGLLISDPRSYLSVVNVSGISAYSVTTGDNKNYFYVVSGINGKPIENASVTFYTFKNGLKTPFKSYTTDSEGKFEFKANRYYEYTIKSGDNRLDGSVYGSHQDKVNENLRYQGSLFTDLSVYRPEAKVGFAGVVYSRAGKHLEAVREKEISVVLCDANRTSLDTIRLVSDRYGRFNGEFQLPATGLNGTWGLWMIDGTSQIGGTEFQVSEYKAPSFITELTDASDTHNEGDTLIFKGTASTYSGMPVTGAKVAYTVSWMPGWWRVYGEKATFGGAAVTDEKGNFEIRLDTAPLKGTPYERGLFQISGEVTDAAGETQPFPAVRFSLGSAFMINSVIPSLIQTDSEPKQYKVAVNDMVGRPVKKKVFYRIVRSDGNIAEDGYFESPAFTPNLDRLTPGKYAFKFSLTQDMVETEENIVRTDSVILWSAKDKRPPVATCLWLPRKRIVAPRDAKTVNVTVGSTLSTGYVLAVISDSKQLISSAWYKISDGNISIPVEVPADDERIFVEVVAESNLEVKREKVVIIPYSQTQALEIKTETFRDRIEPGAEEKWTFSVSLSGTSLPDTPVMAVMTDKSLNAVAPFSWSFNPYGSLYWNSPVGVSRAYKYGGSNNYISPYKHLRYESIFVLPGFNTYGYSLYPSRSYGGGLVVNSYMQKSSLKIRGTSSIVTEVGSDDLSSDGAIKEEVFDESEEAPMAIAESAVVSEMRDDREAEDPLQSEIRGSEFPLAFFMPGLVSDSDGQVKIEFTAPQFVGTWQLQLLGYTPDMRGATLIVDAVSSKAVMANLNAPRFVRTADKASVSANLYNNTEVTLPIGGKIVVKDAVGGAVLTSRDFDPVEVMASGSRLVSMEFEVPENVEVLTIQVYATSSDHRDGEQTVVPVLPATSVVYESKTFYMGPSEPKVAVKLPKYSKDSSVTLSYCGNPTWQCLTALPALSTPDSQSILIQADALFGNAVASGLLRKYPALMDGLRAMAAPENTADSSLYSPLQKNSKLKDILLVNTPWVNAAASETLRMQSLLKYSDESKSEDAVNSAVKLIADRQNADGGWGWCPDMPSSSYMTGRVLGVISGLRNLGYMPADAEKSVRRAFGYMDKSLAEQWERSGRKSYSLGDMVEYLYAKSAFSGIGNAGSFGALEKVAIRDIEKEWRELSLFHKATAAMLLERKGKRSTSRVILESLRQFASESPEKGMWFDNLSNLWNSNGPLLTTARVLQAFAMIEPNNPSIDKLRQWIVLSKQTQDWEASRNATEAICALLSSGSDWTVPATLPIVTIADKTLELPKSSALTGAFSVSLDAGEASGALLKIEKSNATPVWGGVVARFISPIKDTKAQSMPELKVSKELNVVASDASGVNVTTGNLKVGDKVRVTITITCDRDLDYVAVVDNRAACLEPADQLSSYTASDGVWYYREVRDAKTTLFIPYLSKGTHVLWYECHVDRAGEYSSGIVSAQSQYAPLITASSAGARITVK